MRQHPKRITEQGGSRSKETATHVLKVLGFQQANRWPAVNDIFRTSLYLKVY